MATSRQGVVHLISCDPLSDTAAMARVPVLHRRETHSRDAGAEESRWKFAACPALFYH